MSFTHPALLATILALAAAGPSAAHGETPSVPHRAPPASGLASAPDRGGDRTVSTIGMRGGGLWPASAGVAVPEAGVLSWTGVTTPLQALTTHLRDPFAACGQAIEGHAAPGGDQAGVWRALAAAVAIALDWRAKKRRGPRSSSWLRAGSWLPAHGEVSPSP